MKDHSLVLHDVGIHRSVNSLFHDTSIGTFGRTHFWVFWVEEIMYMFSSLLFYDPILIPMSPLGYIFRLRDCC